jgi:hypothetical protein
MALSVGCALAWAVMLAVVAAEASEGTRLALILVFLRWVLGGGRPPVAGSCIRRPGRGRSAGHEVADQAATHHEGAVS